MNADEPTEGNLTRLLVDSSVALRVGTPGQYSVGSNSRITPSRTPPA